MSMIIKGREIVLNDHAKITAKIHNENKSVDVFWYLEKVDENVYPYDNDYSIDYILAVYSHINDYISGSLYPMDKMYFFMIHNKKYKPYPEPEKIKSVVTLKNIITNDIIYNTISNNNTRYTGNYTFNRISKLNLPIYEKFNGIPEDKYQDIKEILGADRCNSVCIDTAMIQTDIGDANNPLSNSCYLYDEFKQISCKLIYPDGIKNIDPIDIDIDFDGSIDISDKTKPIILNGYISVSDKAEPINMNGTVNIANNVNPIEMDGEINISYDAAPLYIYGVIEITREEN